MISTIISKLTGKKVVRTTNFFELPAKEQKRIVKKATHEASIMQIDLVKRVQEKHGITDPCFNTLTIQD